MSIKVVGIDLAKNYFQVCVLNIDGTISSNRKVHRDRLLHTIRQLPGNSPLAMESCASSHYWGRVFLGLTSSRPYHIFEKLVRLLLVLYPM